MCSFGFFFRDICPSVIRKRSQDNEDDKSSNAIVRQCSDGNVTCINDFIHCLESSERKQNAQPKNQSGALERDNHIHTDLVGSLLVEPKTDEAKVDDNVSNHQVLEGIDKRKVALDLSNFNFGELMLLLNWEISVFCLGSSNNSLVLSGHEDLVGGDNAVKTTLSNV